MNSNMQLADMNGYSPSLDITKNYNRNEFKPSNDDLTLIIPMNGNEFLLEYLEIELLPNLTIEHLIMSNVFLYIYTSQTHMVSLRLMLYLNEPRQVDGKIYVKIPVEMFCGAIRTNSLTIKLVMTWANMFMANAAILSKTTYCDQQKKLDIKQDNSEHYIGMAKKYFIEVFDEQYRPCDVSQIAYLEMLAGADRIFAYNASETKPNCKKIHDKLLYIPIGGNESFNGSYFKTFEDGIFMNMTRIGYNIHNVCVHCFGPNFTGIATSESNPTDWHLV